MSNPFAQRLQEVYPEMTIEDVQTEQAAQHYIVLGINYTLVFRFARHEDDAVRLLYEAKELLPTVSRAVRLPVPRPIYESLQELRPVLAFIGYERLTGEPLWPEILEALAGTEEEERTASAIAAFLRELHGVRLPGLPSRDGGEREPVDRLSAKRLDERIRERLFPAMNTDLQKRAEADLEALVRAEAQADSALIHGAFGPAHLLWDAQEHELSGVIGFGSARRGDPAMDLAGILSGYGRSFFEKCLTAYGADAKLDERARLYAKLLPLREALHGIEEGDPETLAYGLEGYESQTGL